MQKILIIILYILFAGCSNPGLDKSQKPETPDYLKNPVSFDLKDIQERGSIVAIVDNSSTSYFIYRGQPMGYEYELLRWFTESMGLELELKIAPSIDDAFRMLNTGEGDVIAHNLTVTKERRKIINFTRSHHTVHQVLVQRKPDNWRDMKLHEIENTLIRAPIDLIGTKVHVRRSSSFAERLKNLSDEIGGDIIVVEEEASVDTEDLIKMVVNKEINYTVADNDVATINKTYYPILDVGTKLSFPQQIAWGVRKNSPKLQKELNNWLTELKRGPEYNVLYNKYFKNLKASKYRYKSDYNSIAGKKISEYDALIQKYADKINWDWLLLASMIYQESRFDPDAESWAGAKGLMQLVDNTASEFGNGNMFDPESNIQAGTNLIIWLEEYWNNVIESEDERLKFILASYNAGHMHVEDSRRLAEKYDADPNVWESNVEKYLQLKSEEAYFSDPVVVAGYCRGDEPVKYVIQILDRYEKYSQLIRGDSTQIVM